MKRIFILLALFLSSCSFFNFESGALKKPLVIVSAAPYEEIVEQIAGNTVSIRGIIPPDVDPHNFEPSPRDMGPLVHASLWIQVGEEFEYLLENRLAETSPSLKIINLPQVTKTITSTCNHAHHGHCNDPVDTHYWLDPITVVDQAKVITKFLIQILPKNKELYEKNFQTLKTKLESLNAKLTKELAPFAHNVYLTTHAAYGYFCHRYDLKQIGIEADDGKEVRSKDIQMVLEKARKHEEELVGILIQPQHVNRAAETIAETMNLPLFMVNPYEKDYLKTIDKLAEITIEYGHRNK
ncbi:zinc ABC transporter substrate-binding protein [bacterium]|nr:zinc ABC transporter substrate-binding protein [bacterium]